MPALAAEAPGRSPLGRLLKVEPEEMAVFLWSALLLFLIRNSNIIFNNFAETTFLKRFGVQYLPLVYMANSIVTFFIMGLMTGIMKRLPSARLMVRLLLLAGGLVASLRLVVGLDFDLIYPALFLLKAQFEGLLALVFWNLANDLFNTRQSKRIFPLITAGGVIGAIVGSFGTPPLARLIQLNNLMLVYLLTTSLGALVVWRMLNLFPALGLGEGRKKKGGKRSSLVAEIKQVIPLLRQSTLVKILVLITFLPNVIIPIMNYQFNFAVNQTFATEGGMIEFFGYFRGGLNIVSLIILLFVGKLYSRWGLPVALMFHPCNYVLAFLAFFFRFDVFSAMYARLSTRVIRMTINNPARDILMGLFPPEYRPLLRPFLRGTVVRLALLLGSGFIMLFEGRLHPKYLSLVGVVFGSLWIASTVWLKRAYPGILLDLISRNLIDLKYLQEAELGHIFQDKRAQEDLVRACLETQGRPCVEYAEMMKAHQVPDWPLHLLEVIQRRDEQTVLELLPLLPPEAGPPAIVVFRKLAHPEKPRLSAALARSAARLPPSVSGEFLRELYQQHPSLEVKAWALAGLYHRDPEGYGRVIDAWLASDDQQELIAGIIAAGGSGRAEYIPTLRALWERQDEELAPHILMALARLQDPGLDDLVISHLRRDPASVPVEVLESVDLHQPDAVRAFIHLLAGPNRRLRRLARNRLLDTPDISLGVIIESLALPNRRIRRGLFEIMERLHISRRDMVAFVRSQLESAYNYLARAAALAQLPPGPELELLRDHFREKAALRVDNILRVLAAQDQSDHMRIVLRGLSSRDSRLRANALEALDTMVGRELSTAMVPLLEDQDPAETLARGRKIFDIPSDLGGPRELLQSILDTRDHMTLYLALALWLRLGLGTLDREKAKRLLKHRNPYVRALARQAAGATGEEGEADMPETGMTLSEKILLLRQMEIFEGLSVAELAAVAAVAEETTAQKGEVIIREGQSGETMYLVVSGKVKVVKTGDDKCSMELGQMGRGEYFGEMALFDDQVRSATVEALEDTHLLVLHKREFAETVREYPQVALQMCKELSRRVRELHQKIKALPLCELSPG